MQPGSTNYNYKQNGVHDAKCAPKLVIGLCSLGFRGKVGFGCFLCVKKNKNQRTPLSHLAKFSMFTLGNVAFCPRIVSGATWQSRPNRAIVDASFVFIDAAAIQLSVTLYNFLKMS